VEEKAGRSHQKSLWISSLFTVVLITVIFHLYQTTTMDATRWKSTPMTTVPTPLVFNSTIQVPNHSNCTTSILFTPTPTLTTNPPIEIPGEVGVIIRNCSIDGVLVELRVYTRVIRDEELLTRIKKELERQKYISSETLELLRVLEESKDRIGLLEITVEIQNKDDKPARVYGGPICMPILNPVVKNITGRMDSHNIQFTVLNITPIKGRVYTGESLYCIQIIYEETLPPGESMHNIYYYIIEKPNINEDFEARVEVYIVGSECKLDFKIVY